MNGQRSESSGPWSGLRPGLLSGLLLFAGFCVVTFVYVRWFLPETKGKTLEEVQEMWADPAELHRSVHTWR